jgi:hypothetical protein
MHSSNWITCGVECLGTTLPFGCCLCIVITEVAVATETISHVYYGLREEAVVARALGGHLQDEPLTKD